MKMLKSSRVFSVEQTTVIMFDPKQDVSIVSIFISDLQLKAALKSQ